MDHMHHGHEMMRRPSSGHEAALRSVQKPPSKPWRTGAPAPTPPKVYRVEPREFRDLVQRLTGAPAARQQRAALAPAQPVPVRAGGEEVAGQMYTAAPWHSLFPLMAPAALHPGLDGHQLI
ncbi:uncharacterized protein [Lolium perenne]|uniref:uncharacterized protein n=1 Tax=Lolium perenne TaxID=4522 RepID=UPI0021EAC4CC|nr:VQ motif-containing protein 9-like [Lolium perenne]